MANAIDQRPGQPPESKRATILFLSIYRSGVLGSVRMSDEAVVAFRVLYLSGYSRPEQHRKIELLADALDVTILNIDGPGCDRNAGILPSANGKRQYVHQIVPTVQIGNAGDVHRFVHWPPRIALRTFKPNLIYCEHEQESLVAAEICLLRNMFASRTPLILYAWQNIVRPRHLPVRLLSQFTLASAQHIVCASSEGIEVLRKQGYHRGASIVPQSGVDTRQFQDKSSALLRASLGLDGFVVGYVGRLVPEKGVDLLLQAAATITTKPRVLIVGDGPSRAALQALAAQLDISERCHFVGFVSPGNIADYYSVMDVLVLPSRTQVHWKEQFAAC